jgi:hypothetical protein
VRRANALHRGGLAPRQRDGSVVKGASAVCVFQVGDVPTRVANSPQRRASKENLLLKHAVKPRGACIAYEQSVMILQVGSRGWFSEKRSIKAKFSEASVIQW